MIIPSFERFANSPVIFAEKTHFGRQPPARIGLLNRSQSGVFLAVDKNGR
jgi:hypothetical protein